MTRPIFLPILARELAAIIREEWPDAARQHMTPGSTALAGLGADALADGTIVFTLDGRQWVTATGSPAALRALSSLADRLEHRGVVVSREGGVRVIGWAVAASEWRDPGSKVVRLRGSYVVAVRHLDAIDPRRIAYDAEVMRAQEERRGKESAPRGSAGTVDRGRMAMGRRTT